MKPLKESLIDNFGDQVKDLRRSRIEEWLKENNNYYRSTVKYIINPDYTININKFAYVGWGNFPDYIQFNECDGDFDCSANGMTTLRGCPKHVGGKFRCDQNDLKNLIGGPKLADDNYSCANCRKMTSLEGGPDFVGQHFDFEGCNVKTYKGGPLVVGGNIYCTDNRLSNSEIQWMEKNIKCVKIYS